MEPFGVGGDGGADGRLDSYRRGFGTGEGDLSLADSEIGADEFGLCAVVIVVAA